MMIESTMAQVFVAVILTVTIGVNISALNYEASSTLLLLPLVAWAVFADRSTARLLYMAASIGGISSCLLAEYVAPDGQLGRHFLGLVLMMIAPAFYFLGRRIPDYRRMVVILGITSAVFGLIIAAPSIVNGQLVRGFRPEDTKAILNVSFFGLPVFASLGVISLAFLLCTQLTLTMAAALIVPVRWMKLLAVGGTFALSYLIFGSESRSAQALIPIYLLLLGFFIYRSNRQASTGRWAVAGLLAIAIMSAVAFNLSNMTIINSRLLQTVARHTTQEASQPASSVNRKIEDEILSNVRDTPVLTGRHELWSGALRELRQSPLYGNGFASYGRYTGGPKNQAEAENTSSHIYYLTVLWKGGLLFGIPFLWLIWSFTRPLFLNLRSNDPAIFFGTAAAFIGLTWMSVWWDALNVPAVGCLIFFLVGMLQNMKPAFATSHAKGPVSDHSVA